MKEMTQEERLNYLVEEFKEDSGRYRNLETPEDTDAMERVIFNVFKDEDKAYYETELQ